jgi:hypothetical protein
VSTLEARAAVRQVMQECPPRYKNLLYNIIAAQHARLGATRDVAKEQLRRSSPAQSRRREIQNAREILSQGRPDNEDAALETRLRNILPANRTLSTLTGAVPQAARRLPEGHDARMRSPRGPAGSSAPSASAPGGSARSRSTSTTSTAGSGSLGPKSNSSISWSGASSRASSRASSGASSRASSRAASSRASSPAISAGSRKQAGRSSVGPQPRGWFGGIFGKR